MIFETKDNYVEVPTNISIYGVVSGQIFLIGIYIACYYRQYYLSTLLVFLYITTVLYWRKLYYMSIVKFLDLFLATAAILLVTFYYSPKYFNRTYRNIWNWCALYVVLIYILNSYIHYSKCIIKENKSSILYIYPLTYANANTEERELEYYRSTLTHSIFIHIMPVIIYTFCCYKSL